MSSVTEGIASAEQQVQGAPRPIRAEARLGANVARLAGLATIIFVSFYSVALGGRAVSVYVLLALLAVALTVLYTAERGGGRRLGLWGIYILAFAVLGDLRAFADQTGIGVRTGYAVAVDAGLFGGRLPSAWLQSYLYEPGRVGALGGFCMVVYGSYFVVPHLLAVLLWWRDAYAFRRYVLSFLLVVCTGLVAFYALPTAPPWLAHQFTDAPRVSRMFVEVFGQSTLRVGSAPGGNAVAAMPSLHMAMTALVVAAVWKRSRGIRFVAVLYGLAMAFGLVYLGEHYVVDELAGITIAAVAWKISPRLLARIGVAELRRANAIADPGREHRDLVESC